MISWGNSLVVENNYGYENVTSLLLGRSVARIDVRPDGSGCDTVWNSAVRSPSTVPELSTANGLLYFYEKQPNVLTIGPEGTAYVGVFNGIVAVRDSR